MLSNLIKAHALELGFDLAGITPLGPVESAERFDAWLAHGFAGEMAYLPRGAEKRRDTRLPFPGAKSAVVVALNYDGTTPSGPIARYARGDDYHDVMLAKLDTLHRWIESHLAREVPGKAYVDTGPILERDLAHKAGLGWIGKNTNLINPDIGSYFFIGSLLLDLELEPDAPFDADRCGTCTRCLDACPTGAIVEPRVLDATRCISYLTIESRGAMPIDLRESVGTLVYGCDICQEVCPWNVSFSRELSAPELAPRKEIDLREALLDDEDEFRNRFRGSPIKRAKRRGLARNIAVAMGNRRDRSDSDALTAALDDPDEMVREHAAWALRTIADYGPR
ncbi:MAG: tRNA epoxyqueuosine(34) reductase QueG [Gemmatimonadaceae bacterium]